MQMQMIIKKNIHSFHSELPFINAAPEIELVTSNFRCLCTACPCKFSEIELITRFDVPHNLTNTQKTTAKMRKRTEGVTGDGHGDFAPSVAHAPPAITVGR
jgi:hypothetical protein